MKALIKVNNNELSFRLKLNYNNVYSRLKMLLGKTADLFADISIRSTTTTWYTDDDADYTALSDVPKLKVREIMSALGNLLKQVKKEIEKSPELAPYVDDILEVPDNNFVFYREAEGGYRFILAAWGCRQAHTAPGEIGGLIRRVSKPADIDEGIPAPRYAADKESAGDSAEDSAELTRDSEKSENVSLSDHGRISPATDDISQADPLSPATDIDETATDETVHELPKKKKEQHVLLKVINQHNKPVEDEEVRIRTRTGESIGVSDENGVVEIGNMPYHSTFNVSFPNMPEIQERAYEVEPKVETYEAYIRKYVNYSPVLFVEDQNGDPVGDYNVKIIIAGQDYILNTGSNGMIQLPTMQEGQKFIVIDSANYANSEEYPVTPESVKKPYLFKIRHTPKSKIGITVLDRKRKPVAGVTVSMKAGDTPCQQTTGKDGRSEFPAEVFTPGPMDVELYVPGKGKFKSVLNFVPDTAEYAIKIGVKPTPFNWKWLLLLPLLLLLGFGGKFLYDWLMKPDKPTIAEMGTGVVMIIGQGRYYADLNVPNVYVNGKRLDKAWFDYNEKGELVGYTFDESQARPLGWSGTGFLISEDGLIATNKHVVDPTPDEDLEKILRLAMQQEKDRCQKMCEILTDRLQIFGARGELNQEYVMARDSLQVYQESVRTLDKILNTGDFKINKEIRTFAAFTGTRVEFYDNLISLSAPRAVGDPGGVTEKDLAIVQINKKQDIPSDAFVFTVPEVDLMDQEIPDNYNVTVLGYNDGPGLQLLKYQDAIKPQEQHGKISNKSEKYRIGYDAPTLGGSSGSPVINDNGELVAVNNSGVRGQQGFNYGVRTKYLKELLDELNTNSVKSPAETKNANEKRRKGKK